LPEGAGGKSILRIEDFPLVPVISF
jgi:hypothetical protein